jgi:hypothetical protein
VEGNRSAVLSEFETLLEKVRELFGGKTQLAAEKSSTEVLLADVLMARLRKGFRQFLRTSQVDETTAAESVMGSVLAGSALADLASVVDRVLLEESSPTAFDFAGRANFISLVEVFQLLAGGMHSGHLILEKPDNRLEVWIKSGRVAFVDPHRMIRRTLTGPGFSTLREIPAQVLEDIKVQRVTDKQPLFLSLLAAGHLKTETFRREVEVLSCELLYEFLCESEVCSFAYRAEGVLPDFVTERCLNLQVTPILLEGHKRMDDWRSLRKVFPNLSEPVRPCPDMFSRMSSLDLGVTEIKILALVDGENSIQDLVETSGLPAFDVCQMLLNLARFGVILPPGGAESLPPGTISMAEKRPRPKEKAPAASSASVSGAFDTLFGSDT